MPDASLVVEFRGREHGSANICAEQLDFALRHTVDGDEKPTAVGHPLWNCVRQLFADRQIHGRSVAKTVARRQTQKGRAGSPLRAESF